jgi:hypothetical protein
MRTGENLERRTSKIDVLLGSLLGLLVAAGLVAIALELIAIALAAAPSAAQALSRSTEAFVALERHVARGGAVTGYRIPF